ncbi:MAG: sugar ABC transporter permease [Anaerolineales bacterium]|nr:sugar ABC transporter permease [Anaerolineales bacterium]
MKRAQWVGWAFLSPTLIVLAITGLLPFIYVLYVGFFDWNIFSAREGLNFAGVNNYRRLVFDPEFLRSLWYTIQFTFWSVSISLILGFMLAQLLIKDFPGKTFFRVVHALPLMIAPIAVGALWRLMVIPGFGPLWYGLEEGLGFKYRIGASGTQAFLTTIFMDVWHWTPFVTLTMLAGLSAIPQEPKEAAMVDGASTWQVYRYITIPMMMPIILTTVFIRIMDALRIVDEVFMLTGGGPGDATRYIGLHIFRVVFPKTDYGYGSATSLLTLYFTIVFCWLLFVAITSFQKK